MCFISGKVDIDIGVVSKLCYLPDFGKIRFSY